MKTFKQKLIFRIALTLLGVLGGYLYWRFVGCSSGHCPITSKWYLSSLYGGVIGYLISGLFIKDKQKEQIDSEQNK
ncbi:MAG: hypothetical protein C0596_05490 [Marinilabiliales bacterium]|nr:MAG: hypothetical protein C0596_05490 [Marinilabiliales bacterium]